MQVDFEAVDVEIDDDNTGTFLVFELRIGMNEFDHRSLFFIKLHKYGIDRVKIPPRVLRN